MARDVDWLPWILGGCLALGAAAVTAVALSATQRSPVTADAAPAASPLPPAPVATASASASAAPADPSPVIMPANARQRLPPGQVWECEVNGQRVFSDTRCDTHATVRQLSDLNLMDSSTAPRPAPSRYAYESPYPPGAVSARPSDYTPPVDEAPADYSSEAYVGEQYTVVRDRDHRVHRPRLHAHPRARPHR